MLKIVEIHPAAHAQGEYLVLQNQGLVSVSLRGWAVCGDAYLKEAADVAEQMYIFREDVTIKPYTQVVLFTGQGEDGWVPTIDGRQAYCAYWQRADRIWSCSANVHVLHVCASKRIPNRNSAPPSPITA